jgi:hypothetical protein
MAPIVVTLILFYHFAVVRGEALTPSIAFTSESVCTIHDPAFLELADGRCTYTLGSLVCSIFGCSLIGGPPFIVGAFLVSFFYYQGE